MGSLLDLIAQAPFPGGPDPSGGLQVSARAFVAVLAAGFLIAIAGHVVRSRPLVAFGIALVFGATVIVPVLLAIVG